MSDKITSETKINTKIKTYAEAMERLDVILEDIDESKISIDDLAERVVEAADLLKQCRKVLTETEAKVKNVLTELDQEFGEELSDAGSGEENGEEMPF